MGATPSKDHEEPKDLAFEYEVVETGWADDMGEPMTSVALHLSEAKAPGKREKPLRGANKIAYAALMDLCTAGNALKQSAQPVDIEEWRKEAYKRSISPSPESDSKKRAFNRAVTLLRDSGHVLSEEDRYWPSSLPKSNRDRSGQTGTFVPPCPGTDRDKTLKGCPELSRMADGAESNFQGVLS